MKNFGFYQSTFTRQTNNYNCGIACICMILRYAGKNKNADELAGHMETYVAELSLLDLKNMVKDFGWNARCVKVDLATLRDLKNPFIMHTVNEDGRFHFLLLFAVKKRAEGCFYIVGDPSHGIKIMSEHDLSHAWVSSTGLYIENLIRKKSDSDLLYWKNALEWHLIPKPLWYCVPFMNLMSFLFGITLSAFLQQLLTGRANIGSLKLRIAVLVLLFVIMIGKSLFTYLKQRLMISINKIVNLWLATRLANNIASAVPDKSQQEPALRKKLLDSAKFQLSINGLISIILSDGLVLLTLIGSLLYLDLYAALINLGYIAAALWLVITKMPDHLFSAIYLNDLYYRSEKILLSRASLSRKHATTAYEDNFDAYYRDYIQRAGNSAAQYSVSLFRNEAFGGFTVILVLGLDMALGNTSAAFLIAVTVLTYLITIFLQRVSSAFPVVYEGIQAARTLNL